VAEPVTLRFLWRPRLKDPNDEMVLETAVNGQASHLVTFNLRHLGEAPKGFGIHVNTPGEIWREIRGAKPCEGVTSPFAFRRRCWTRPNGWLSPRAWR
jgi:hypothetical protein